MASEKILKQRVRRSQRTRRKLIKSRRPRLSVSRSLQNIYAQIIDDEAQKTLASASSQDKTRKLEKGGSVAAAQEVGKLIAERAKEAGVQKVVFDRGAFLYHGRVKALAEAARENGLEF